MVVSLKVNTGNHTSLPLRCDVKHRSEGREEDKNRKKTHTHKKKWSVIFPLCSVVNPLHTVSNTMWDEWLSFRHLLGSSLCIITVTLSRTWHGKEYRERRVLVEESYVLAHGTGIARSVTLLHILCDKLFYMQHLTFLKLWPVGWADDVSSVVHCLSLARLMPGWGVVSFQIRQW